MGICSSSSCSVIEPATRLLISRLHCSSTESIPNSAVLKRSLMTGFVPGALRRSFLCSSADTEGAFATSVQLLRFWLTISALLVLVRETWQNSSWLSSVVNERSIRDGEHCTELCQKSGLATA